MAWAGFSIVTGGATLSFTSISTDEFGSSPLVVYSDRDLTTAITFPLSLTDDPTACYLDLGQSTSQDVWLTFGQADGSAINVSKQATPNMVIEVDPTPSYRQLVEDVSDITDAISSSEASLTLEIGGKVDKLGEDDIVITTSSVGLVLTSPDGSAFRVTIGDDGALTSSELEA